MYIRIDNFFFFLLQVELTIINQNDTINVKDEISNIKYADENIWKLMEYQQYQSEYANTNTFNITLLIFIIFILGIILSVSFFRWWCTKKKVISMKI